MNAGLLCPIPRCIQADLRDNNRMNADASTPPVFNPQLARWAAMASVAVVVTLIIIKAGAYWLSGSVSVLGSLMDSLMDSAASLMTLLAIHISLLPPDKNHRYGHGKVEGIASLLQAGLIAGAAFYLALEAAGRLSDPQPVAHATIGLVVMAIAIVLSLALVRIQTKTLAAAPSVAVEADRAHYSTDIYINGGVFVAIILQMLGGPDWIDPVVALGIALFLCRTVMDVGKAGIDMLLDREMPPATRADIERIILSDPRIHGVHDLRTRASGMRFHISFDIEVDGTLSLTAAHNIALDVERGLLSRYPNAEIMIHIDPLGEPDDARHEIPGLHL